MPRRPWTSLDVMRKDRLLTGVVALAALTQFDYSSSSSSSSFSSSSVSSGASSFTSSRSSSSKDSSSSSSKEEWHGWRDLVALAQAGMLDQACVPFRRKPIKYAIGTQRLSFDRIQKEYAGTVTCLDHFRFNLPQLRRLLVGLRFPRQVTVREWDTSLSKWRVQASATGEEAMLIMLRRLSYPMKWSELAIEAGRDRGQLSRIFHWSIEHV